MVASVQNHVLTQRLLSPGPESTDSDHVGSPFKRRERSKAEAIWTRRRTGYSTPPMPRSGTAIINVRQPSPLLLWISAD